MKIQVAFYKAKGTIADKAIRLWTRSPYSHAEVIVNGVWYSATTRGEGVRAAVIEPKEGHWDFVEVDIPYRKRGSIGKFFKETDKCTYDWRGIVLSQVFPLKKHDTDKWFCSEWRN